MKKDIKILIGYLVVGTFLTGFCTGCGKLQSVSSEKQEVEVFLTKAEAIETFKNLEKKFEKSNPNIDIIITSPAQAMTVLKTRLVKNDVPDIITMAGELNYADFIDAGILEDLSKEKEIINRIKPSYVDVLESLEFNNDSAIYGIPYACNAGGVIYNKDIFNEMGLEIPTTWDDFISLCDTLKEKDITPIYYSLKDAWTGMVAWNAITANTQPKDFFTNRRNDETTFGDVYGDIAEKMKALLNYGHSDNFGVGYNDGNIAFAQGKAAMMLQGNWVIPEILKINPDSNLGMFVLPVNNDKEKNSVVSGVDLLFAIPKDTDTKEDSLKFIEFMTKSENMKQYVKEQFAIPAVKDIYQEDKTVEDLNPYFKSGMVLDFPDHHYPSAMQVQDLVQGYLFDKDLNKLLYSLDNRWERATK